MVAFFIWWGRVGWFGDSRTRQSKLSGMVEDQGKVEVLEAMKYWEKDLAILDKARLVDCLLLLLHLISLL